MENILMFLFANIEYNVFKNISTPYKPILFHILKENPSSLPRVSRGHVTIISKSKS